MGNTIAFKGKTVLLQHDPRVGVCNWCRAVVGIDCDRTHLHHIQYDDANPLRYTIELYPLCHRMAHRGIRNIEEPTDKVIRIRSKLFKEMSESDLARRFSVDFDDICSEVWEFWKENH